MSEFGGKVGNFYNMAKVLTLAERFQGPGTLLRYAAKFLEKTLISIKFLEVGTAGHMTVTW